MTSPNRVCAVQRVPALCSVQYMLSPVRLSHG